MAKHGSRRILAIGAAGVAVALLGGCAADKTQDKRLSELESKVNEALRNSAAAKVDATTALSLALKAQRADLMGKINEALRASSAAKIDATTALDAVLRTRK